jgi:hypothetical protein
MPLPVDRCGRVLVASLALVTLAAMGCDAGEDPGVWKTGPTFLIVGAAASQPASPQDGTAIFVQARGGSFVSIVTYGGKHRYTTLGYDAKASCAELPGTEPLYLFVKPDDRECLVEVRLYSDCDSLGDGGLALGVCGSHDSFIASEVLTVLSRAGAADAAREANVGADAADVVIDISAEADASPEADR